jgi:acetyl-CoA acetyltransferase
MSAHGRRVAIAGYAQTPIVRHADAPLGASTASTARAAIADAGLRVADVDGFVTVPLMPAIGDHVPVDGIDFVTTGWLAHHLGVYPRFLADFSGGGQITGTVALAAHAIASGAAETVVVHRALHNPQGRYHGTQSREATGLNQWTTPQGHFGPIVTIALAYTEYLQRFGATREAMAAVVVEARKNGARIPWSYWCGKPLSVDEYLAAPLINDPMGRLDCDIPVDGVAAFVLTSAERAGDLPHRPVYVGGTAIASPPRRRLPMHWPLDDIYEAGQHVVGRLFEHTGLGAADIDLPQMYDGFSPIVWFWLEALGFCPVGEAHRFVQDGRIDSDAPDGLPILSGGGALGNGRMHGVPQMLECYLQLSGRAGDRQRERATVGVACQGPPHVGGIALYTNEPL